jgi:hypothetical protein
MSSTEDASESSGGSTAAESSSGDPTSCTPGQLGCACDGGTCAPGLFCNDAQVCAAESESSGDTSEGTSEGTSTGSGESTEATSSGDVTTMSGPECHTPGEPDVSSECTDLDPQRPFCAADGACVACSDDAQCAAGTDGLKPVCRETGRLMGACVECDTANPVDVMQCSEKESHCNLDTFKCEGCLEHSECGDTACDVAKRTCFTGDRLLYVRRGPTMASPCTYDVPTGGYPDKPYCAMQPAIEHAQFDGLSSGWIFIIMGSDSEEEMPAFTIPNGDLPVSYAVKHTLGTLIDKHTRFSDLGPIVTVGDKVTLYLIDMGVHVLENAFDDIHRGIDCKPGGSIWLDDSRVLRSVGPGIKADHCEVHLRRSSIAFGRTEGIEMAGGSLHLVNSFMDENRSKPNLGGGALSMSDGAVAEIVYSTLANNKNVPLSQRGDTVDCNGPVTVKIRNSIFAREPGTGNQSIVCEGSEVVVSDSVVDGNFPADQGNHKLAAEDILDGLSPDGLTGAYLIMDPESALKFKNMAVWQEGDPFDDYNRQPRNAIDGEADYAGADYYVP